MFTAALIALCAIDLEHMLLPNKIIYPSAAMIVPLFVLAAAVDDQWANLGRAALGGLAGFAMFYAIWFAVPSAPMIRSISCVTTRSSTIENRPR